VVGALVAVNCLGDVVDPQTGQILAGARHPEAGGFLNSSEAIKRWPARTTSPFANTTIGVVATNARLSKEETNKLAQLALDGYSHAIRPTTMYDGDALFAFSAGDKPGDLSAIGAAGSQAVAEAIVRAIRSAESLYGIPAHRDI
jgi:L-aminopeptidase/D-esterase-like protein